MKVITLIKYIIFINNLAILRHHDIFKTKGNANNEKHLETLNKNIANEKKKLEETLEKIKES